MAASELFIEAYHPTKIFSGFNFVSWEGKKRSAKRCHNSFSGGREGLCDPFSLPHPPFSYLHYEKGPVYSIDVCHAVINWFASWYCCRLKRENCETMVLCKSRKELSYPLVFWSADSHALTCSDISCFLNSVVLVVHKSRKISKLCRHTCVPDHMTLRQERLLVRQLTDPPDTKIALKTYVIVYSSKKIILKIEFYGINHTL